MTSSLGQSSQPQAVDLSQDLSKQISGNSDLRQIEGDIANMMDDLGVTPNQPYSTTDASDVGRVLPGTELVATVPSRVARLLSEQYSLAGVRWPLDLKIEVHMFWAPRSETSPLNAWLRDLIREAAALQPPAWHV